VMSTCDASNTDVGLNDNLASNTHMSMTIASWDTHGRMNVISNG
jgi:hypothetical protein